MNQDRASRDPDQPLDLSIDEVGARAGIARRARLQLLRRLALGLVAGVLLTAAALTIFKNKDAALQAWHAARTAPLWLIVPLLILPLVNIASVAVGFWIMTERYGRVRLIEMLALICSGWMLNNLPLRPGLVGRVAYHALVNKIPVRASLTVLMQTLLCAGGALTLMLSVVYLASRAALPQGVLISAASAPAIFLAFGAWSLRQRARTSHAWRWIACIACRYVDILVWALRYWLIFQVIGRPMPMVHAGVVAAASEAAMLSPVQIGLREWVVGTTSSWLAEPVRWSSELITLGLLADFTNRGIEVALGVPLGLIAAAWLFKRVRIARAGEPAAAISR